ncbi:Ferredoxin-dependent bilin reductase [Arabidopsis thaliana x Arabidopsis arenosa]|uniref:Ferredoxin-dependent bilin reductase n=1 Tax=Arabidopsis thaliana x Arabidopsis arenosa TaxID=1240361 RepID=A0A8T2ATQ8_9BRAS|nr:Ferredoxin-dependent bilin reductase [Arabidopsis thaliana x Arabidopsis arenosa]
MALSMESGFSIGSCFKAPNPPVLISASPKKINFTLRRRSKSLLFRVSAVSYKEFAESALEETRKRIVLEPSHLQEKYSSMTGLDGKTELRMLAFKSSKIRLLRSMAIENETMQVFDFAGFMEPEYDTPIFCANFFTSANVNIVVLDLNPLHQLTDQTDYQEKYYNKIMSIYHKYAETFPWGGKLTGESIKFFSPLVMWTRFSSSQEKHKALFSAFLEYYQAWLEMTIQVREEMEPSQVRANCEAQHKYLTWRAQKDPGHGLLKRLVGEEKAMELLRDFLFNGVDELGTKTFIDYFPEYQTEDGTVNDKRSIIGKSYETRPWDLTGQFIG